MRPIDADVVQEHLNELMNNEHCDSDLKKTCSGLSIYLDDVPTINNVDINHGKWRHIYNEEYEDYIACCSVCGKPDALSRNDYSYRGGKIRDNDSNYCPCCGANMDGGDLNED